MRSERWLRANERRGVVWHTFLCYSQTRRLRFVHRGVGIPPAAATHVPSLFVSIWRRETVAGRQLVCELVTRGMRGGGAGEALQSTGCTPASVFALAVHPCGLTVVAGSSGGCIDIISELGCIIAELHCT